MQTITLNNGVEMPIIGFGTYQITDPAECERCVVEAVATGYRLIDTAQAYGNEEAVGAGIARCGVPREELFITTKLWFRNYERDSSLASLEASLRRLGTDYVDLVLLHWPFGNTYAAWRALEELQRDGRTRAIGVSNYAPSQLIDLIEFNEVVPAVNQVETNLLAQQNALHELMADKGIAHQAYAPFGQGRANEMFNLPEVTAAARAHGKTPRQVALRFMIQRGIGVIPKSTHAERMAENLDVFDFELTGAEMTALASIDTDRPMIGNPQDATLAASAITW
ncbi:Aldo/keto reductase [Actinomyces ruminicola]|uniref:Aldo/keto reductase n=1 Tax=Actinomyces ruminicola TaxID=332524 RepID=A0A1H0A197_9ACTO|nr:aldo/keto reductase [Actinomyces ruminicola]SDN26733.1 Aldo/keto reductase [Actinomyces ruminicola]